MFHSPKSAKACTFSVAGERLVDQLEVRPHMTERVITNFVDSPDAAATAKGAVSAVVDAKTGKLAYKQEMP